jgi:hypothetical protein
MSLKRDFGALFAIINFFALNCHGAHAVELTGAGYDDQNRVNYYYGYLYLPSIDYTNRYYSNSENKICRLLLN